MELTAAIEALAAIEGHRRVHLHSDSAYVVNCFRERWWERWERQGWRNAGKQPVANRDLWERLLAQSRRQYPLVVLGLLWRAECATGRIVNKHSPWRTNFNHNIADGPDH